MTNASERILRLVDVKQRIGVSRSSIYAWVKEGSFPKPINLGVHSVGWIESEIDAWIFERVNKSREIAN